MASPVIQTVSVETIRELVARIESLERRLGGGLRPGEADPSPSPEDLIVKTPEGGIAARSGTTISSELCDVYTLEYSSDTEATLTAVTDGASAYQVRVWNVWSEPIGSEVYVMTARMKSGYRYPVCEECS
jgi:hypothetical protein